MHKRSSCCHGLDHAATWTRACELIVKLHWRVILKRLAKSKWTRTGSCLDWHMIAQGAFCMFGMLFTARQRGARALDGAIDGMIFGVVQGNTVTCIPPQHDHSGSFVCLSRRCSLMSVQFTSSRPISSMTEHTVEHLCCDACICNCHPSVLLCSQRVNRQIVGSHLYRPHFLPDHDSSSTCSIQANIGTLCHDKQEMLHFLFVEF